MIYFLTTRKASYTIHKYLRGQGAELAGKIVPLTYRQFLRVGHAQPGTYIFSDIERLTLRTAERVSQKWHAMASEGRYSLLNHPTQTMRRYELLRTLHERGINGFNIYRPDEIKSRSCNGGPIRYPVFIRGENDHKGSQTPLLRNAHELSAAIIRLRYRWKGWRPKVITEFCDVADSHGVFRKYAAFKVGEQILTRHVFFANHWSVKSWQLLDKELLAEERAYIHENPHEALLREIFTLANVDFGRIDYGLIDGRIQVWEINTNPMLPVDYGGGGAAREPLHQAFLPKMQAAFETLDSATVARSTQALAA